MGAIVSIIKTIGDSGYDDVGEDFKVFIDFEGTVIQAPEEEELEVVEEVIETMKRSAELLDFVKKYGVGGKDVIYASTTSPGDVEKQEEAWNKIVPMIRQLLACKHLSDQMCLVVPKLLAKLWRSGEEPVVQSFEKNPASVVQLGKILDVTMRFDDLKMAAPSMQNDISYIKRQITVKMRKGEIEEGETDITTDNMNELAMFFIHPSPMMKKLIETVTNFFKELSPPGKTEPLDIIVAFAKVCIKILDSDMRDKFQQKATISLIERILTALTLLYDHLSPSGVFVKESPIDIRYVVDILDGEIQGPRRRSGSRGAGGSPLVTRRRPGGSKARRVEKRRSTLPNVFGGGGSPKSEVVDLKKDDRKSKSEDDIATLETQAKNLLNVLKYSNKHLKDPTTPKNVESLFNKII